MKRQPGLARRVLVIGARGQVGRQLITVLESSAAPVNVVAASRSDPHPSRRLELARPETIERLILDAAPDHVILTAAATNVAWCELHPEEARVINVDGTSAAALAARRASASLTFISTDYVFDGMSGPYAEDAPTNPINAYGAQKLQAERAVLSADPKNLVIRTCQVFGNDPRRTNFVLRVADRLRAHEPVEAAVDLFGTPTYAPDLARALVQLTLDGAAGIWNVAGDTFLSRYELARMVAGTFGGDLDLIVEVEADRVEDPVNRPRRAGLRNKRLEAAGLRLITPLARALAELASMDAPH